MFRTAGLFCCLLPLISSFPTAPPCTLDSVSTAAAGSKDIQLTCHQLHISIQLADTLSVSSLKVTGQKDGEPVQFLSVEYFKDLQDMTFTINGERFGVKDGKDSDESTHLLGLLQNPDFQFFPPAARLIHDQLQLKGWESPAVLFLYKLAMTTQDLYSSQSLGALQYIDSDIYDYHGPNPTKQCTLNGWTSTDMEQLNSANCIGICGPKCLMCWKWVCGDCCMHTGCKRHDGFCREGGKFTKDCMSLRGVLWDTITDTPYDC